LRFEIFDNAKVDDVVEEWLEAVAELDSTFYLRLEG
jgi:hypothetical protein